MSKAELVPDLTKANIQLSEIKAAIISGNYESLQGLLLQQSVILHEIGMVFFQKSNDSESVRHKRACCELGCRLFNQARKTMESIKHLEC